MVKYKTFKFYFNNTQGKVHASLVIFVLQGWKWTVSCSSRFSPENKSPWYTRQEDGKPPRWVTWGGKGKIPGITKYRTLFNQFLVSLF